MIGDRHATLDANPDPLARLGFSGEELLEQGHHEPPTPLTDQPLNPLAMGITTMEDRAGFPAPAIADPSSLIRDPWSLSLIPDSRSLIASPDSRVPIRDTGSRIAM
jgi:hypothetical protein